MAARPVRPAPRAGLRRPRRDGPVRRVEGPVGDSADCDDAAPTTYPGAPEACDAIDSDCDGGLVDDFSDLDGDGAPDCIDSDADGDGQTSKAAGGTDCDDLDATIAFGVDEICDGADSNCDGALPSTEQDLDGDLVIPCQGDCDDNNDARFPGNPEVCDGLDNDCDGAIEQPGELTFTDWYLDADGDGFGNPDSPHPLNPLCIQPPGYVLDTTDCNDGQATVNPDENEVPDNGRDDDCVDGDARAGGPRADAPGCACSTEPGAPAPWALGLLVLLRRRRDRRSRPPHARALRPQE